jgi:hypothetical protein
MQYEISDQAAIQFSARFYTALARGLPVDAAVAGARIGMSLATRGSAEWGTPVLYMQAPDGHLFALPAWPAAPPDPPVQAAEPVPAQTAAPPAPAPSAIQPLVGPGEAAPAAPTGPAAAPSEAALPPGRGRRPHWLTWIALAAAVVVGLSALLGSPNRPFGPPSGPLPPEGPAAGYRARVVKRYGAAIRETPDGAASILAMAACNDLLEIQQTSNGWHRVSGTRASGWVGTARVATGGTPGPVDCSGAVVFPVGSTVTTLVPSGCLSLRTEPNRNAPFEHCVANGHRYQVVNGPREEGGEDWFQLSSPSTGSGWSLAEHLRPGG